MAFTEADLTAIQTAIAKGEDSVTFADRTVTYRSMGDLLQAEARITSALRTRAKQTMVTAAKGFA